MNFYDYHIFFQRTAIFYVILIQLAKFKRLVHNVTQKYKRNRVAITAMVNCMNYFII